MNILSIGNSFSKDAQRYLHQIARADGAELTAVNLYIGGCPISRHYRTMLSGERAYTLEINGYSTGFFVSLEEALLNRNWDVITLQQVSHESVNYETYQPYLNELVAYVRHCVPKAKILIHQTWAYEQGSKTMHETLGFPDQKDMFLALKAAYAQASQEICADGILPSGEVFQALLANDIEKVHRDMAHAGWGLGRYALGLTWYAVLTGRNVDGIAFSDFDEEVTPQQIAIVKKCVQEVAEKYRS